MHILYCHTNMDYLCTSSDNTVPFNETLDSEVQPLSIISVASGHLRKQKHLVS